MRAGAAAGHVGHFHEAGFYSSDDEFRALILPFVEEGLQAGEPVVIGYDQRKSDLLRGWLPDPSAVTFVTDTALYATPAGAIANYGRLFAQHVATGAPQIRIAGDVPHEGNGGRFAGWDRYESAVNIAWEQYPVRSVCLYDATTVSPQVTDVVHRTHPRLLTPTGQRHANPRYEDPSTFVGLPATPDPLEDCVPAVELHGATPADARHAVKRLAAGRLDDVTLSDLVLAVSEAATNADMHGRAPMRIRIWTAPDRVMVHVHDTGPGPTNQLAGLIPVASGTSAGLGLWLIHQLNLDVALLAEPDGFTVRLRAGVNQHLLDDPERTSRP